MMSISSKSPQKVLMVAHEAARRAMPPYYHRFAPKKFTRHQLFACLVLKTRLKLDYRGVEQLLIDSPSLQACIGLAAVPHWTTLHKNAERLLSGRGVKKLLESTLTLLRPKGKSLRVKHGAADSSGFDTHHASRYFIWRRDNQKGPKDRPKRRVSYRRFGKLMVLICCATHLVVAAVAGAGPTPDIDQLDELMHRPPPGVRIEHVLADAGFDSAHNHRLLRETHGIRSTIPPDHGRPPKDGKLPSDRYRRLMKTRFNAAAYRKRSQVESGFSMIKRNFGSSLRGRTYQSRRRDMLLMVLTHNIAIRLRRVGRGYLQSLDVTFSHLTVDGPASRRKFVLGIMPLGASRWPPQIVIRYVAQAHWHVGDEYTDIIQDFLGGPHSEAIAWLGQGPAGVRTLGEHQSQAESLSLVQRLYALGSESVIAVGYGSDEDDHCRYLLVQLPTRESYRESLFRFERDSVESHGFEGTPDEGQEYLFIDVKNFA